MAAYAASTTAKIGPTSWLDCRLKGVGSRWLATGSTMRPHSPVPTQELPSGRAQRGDEQLLVTLVKGVLPG